MNGFLATVGREISARIAHAAYVRPADARRYLEELENLTAQLDRLRETLRERASRPSSSRRDKRKVKLAALPN